MGEVTCRPRDPMSNLQDKVPYHNVSKQSSTAQRPQGNSNETQSKHTNNAADGEWRVSHFGVAWFGIGFQTYIKLHKAVMGSK